MESISTQVALSAIIIWLMNWAKRSKLVTFMSAETETVNRLVAVALTGLASLGVHMTHSYDPLADGGTFHLVITGVALGSILAHGRDWIFSYVVTKSGYKLIGGGGVEVTPKTGAV